MDALKAIAAGSVKETTPKFNVGDTVKVREKEFRCLRAQLLLKRAVVLLKHLL